MSSGSTPPTCPAMCLTRFAQTFLHAKRLNPIKKSLASNAVLFPFGAESGGNQAGHKLLSTLSLISPSVSAVLSLLGDRRCRDGLNGDKAPGASAVDELDAAIDLRKERVIAAAADVQTRFERCSTLPHDDRAASDQLAAESLHAKPLSI